MDVEPARLCSRRLSFAVRPEFYGLTSDLAARISAVATWMASSTRTFTAKELLARSITKRSIGGKVEILEEISKVLTFEGGLVIREVADQSFAVHRPDCLKPQLVLKTQDVRSKRAESSLPVP